MTHSNHILSATPEDIMWNYLNTIMFVISLLLHYERSGLDLVVISGISKYIFMTNIYLEVRK
jgi:hypothetical protein